jgi:quercetin dioxygenase-like cupin family protein
MPEMAPPRVVALAEILAGSDGPGPLWTATTDDLNVNLLSFEGNQGVPRHVNDEVDVLIVGIAGEGDIEIDGEVQRLGAGGLCLIPKGAARALRATGGRFAYLSCHRRRGGLWPA